MSLLDWARRPLATADAGVNRLYGWKHNPLYHSGVLAATLLAVVMATGLYLIFFWGVSAPYASVERITTRVFLGAFARSMHRYASDAAILAVLVHALRMWLQRRTWGPRALAWLSGFALLGTVWVLGWTGYVMVWDVQGEVLAREGARWLDALPLFSEPIGRAFDGERALPGAFFFLNLFAHVALPVALGLVFWLHVAPPRKLLIGVVALLAAAAVLVPVRMAPPADPFRLPVAAPYDFFYAFFLPLTQPLKPWMVWLLGGAVVLAVALVPSLMRPRGAALPSPSVVDERSCTGCEQCWLDCPYEAIRMVERTDGRPYLVARVDPALCTSCGICAGSCAPMGVGPPGRTGKDQLDLARRFAAAHPPSGGVVIIACRQAGGLATRAELEGAPVFSVSCSGNLHTSVVEFFVRSGAGGVLVVACPPRDCWNREGPVWLEQRLYHDREAELLPRVDKRRVRLTYAGAGEGTLVAAALRAFRAGVQALEAASHEAEPDLTRECDVVAEGARATGGGEEPR
jgi:ferredoxin